MTPLHATPMILRTDTGPAGGPPAEAGRGERFLLRLGGALHRHGLPADRLEEALGSCARALGLRAQLFCTPTSLFASFGEAGEGRAELLRVEPGEVDLGRLADLDELIEAVGSGALSAEAGEARLDELAARTRRWGPAATLLAFGPASAAAACFLGGSLGAAAAAWVVGTLLGVLVVVSAGRSTQGRLLEPAGALAAALTASVLAPEGGVEVATLAALIVILPGFSFTVGMTELATRHLAAGTARLAGTAVSFLSLGFGVAVGWHLGDGALVEALRPALALPDAPLPAWALPAALLAAPAAFTVLFGARRRDAPWILLGCLVAWGGATLGVAWLGPRLGAVLGATALAAGSHLLERHSSRPALVTLVPGIMLLVPGSVGFQSVRSFLAADTLGGVEAAFRTGLVAVSLVAGLLVAQALVPPRRAL